MRGMNDHLHATGFLEQLKGGEPTPKRIWEAIQTLFAAINEVQENVASRFGAKTRVAFTTSPGYSSMPLALQFVYAILILIAEGNGWRVLMAAPNRELEPTNLRLCKSELAAAWADVSHALRGFHELADILIVLDEVLLLEVSNFARQLKLSPILRDDHPVIIHLTASLWFRDMELTITSSTSRSRGPNNERQNVATSEKQLESMGNRLAQEGGRWPFLSPRLENATRKTGMPGVISVPRSSKRVELKMGDGSGVLITNLGVVWKLLRPSWCPHPHASMIEEVTERVRLAPTEDEDLAILSIVHKLILPQVKESSEVTSGTEPVRRMEPGSCLDSTCSNGEHICDGRLCVRIQSFQKEDLTTWFEDITEREKSEVQIVAECYARTTVNLATALGFFSRMCSLQSLERLESEHHLVTALSVESWPGVLQVNQKHIKSWKIGLEAEMGFPMSEAYGLPLNAKSLVGSVLANLCGSHYPLHMAMVEVSSQRVVIDKAFSVPKCVRLARMSHHSHKLLRKIRGAVPKEQRDDLSEIWGEELLGLESENASDHGKQNVVVLCLFWCYA